MARILPVASAASAHRLGRPFHASPDVGPGGRRVTRSCAGVALRGRGSSRRASASSAASPWAPVPSPVAASSRARKLTKMRWYECPRSRTRQAAGQEAQGARHALQAGDLRQREGVHPRQGHDPRQGRLPQSRALLGLNPAGNELTADIQHRRLDVRLGTSALEDADLTDQLAQSRWLAGPEVDPAALRRESESRRRSGGRRAARGGGAPGVAPSPVAVASRTANAGAWAFAVEPVALHRMGSTPPHRSGTLAATLRRNPGSAERNPEPIAEDTTDAR